MELWRTDGTAEGTFKLAALPYSKDVNPYLGPVRAGGRLFFRFLGTLWTSDGSVAGTQPLPHQPPGGVSALSAGPSSLYVAAGYLDGGDQALWSIDPETLEPSLLGTFSQVQGYIGNPLGNLLGDTLLFPATDAQGIWHWWVTEGTAASTRLVPDPLGSDMALEFVSAGECRYFSACDTDHGCELWSTDRLGEDTRMVEDFWPGPRGSDARVVGVTDTSILIAATEPSVGSELWEIGLSEPTAASSRSRSTAYSGR